MRIILRNRAHLAVSKLIKLFMTDFRRLQANRDISRISIEFMVL
jgi:hypothetical protein